MARGDFPSTKQDQYMVRFPDGMRERIKAAAEANNRSMNAEIVFRLERTFEDEIISGHDIGDRQPDHAPSTSDLSIFPAEGFDLGLLAEALSGVRAKLESLDQKVDALAVHAKAGEDAADAAAYDAATASMPPEQLSTDHLRPKAGTDARPKKK